MLRRLISLVALVWALGFLLFSVTLPRPAQDEHTDAVAVLTGGEGRIDRGLGVLRAGLAPRMLVAGVDPEVKPGEFSAQYHVEARLMRCCVTLGYESVDTRSNATEITQWLSRNKAGSVRLVTSDWHMRRATRELRLALPANVTVVEDAVPSQPSFKILFLEYNKLVARQLFRLWRRA